MSSELEYNAVFKGGGAKGIAYAGALQACEERGVVFREVAGSSAGAITATLVACGYTAAEVIEQMPAALASIGGVGTSLAMVGTRSSLLGNRGLRRWLGDAIAAKIPVPAGVAAGGRSAGAPSGRPPESPGDAVTFLDIERVTGIKLYVVTLDLATRQPRVFSPDLTPASPVAAAVVASSSIPVAFPASRMEVEGAVHRLVDGGTWANYPTFVFHDQDFRRCHGLGENTRPTLGFVLEQGGDVAVPYDSPQPRAGGRLIVDRGSGTQQMGVVGAMLSSTAFRWLAALVPLMFVVLSMLWIRDEMQRDEPWLGRLPESMHELVLVIAVGILAVTGLLALSMSFVIVRLGRTLFDSGIVSAIAAMGVGPSVPYWEGHADGTHAAVRIRVPPQLGTLSFKPTPPTQQAAHRSGYDATWKVLDSMNVPKPASADGVGTPDEGEQAGGGRAGGGTGKTAGLPLRVVRWLLGRPLAIVRWVMARAVGWVRRWWVARSVAALFVVAGGTLAVYRAMENFAVDRTLSGLTWLLVVGMMVAIGAWLLAQGRWSEANHDRPYRVLGRFKVRTLTAIGLISLLFVSALAVGQLLSSGASILTASRADAVEATLSNVRTVPGQEPLVDVLIGNGELARVSGDLGEAATEQIAGGSFLDTLVDLDGKVVLRCAAPDGELCFTVFARFIPLPELVSSVGEEIDVRVDLERGRMFVEDDIFDRDRGPLTVLTVFFLGLAFVGLATRSLRAANWRRQQEEHEQRMRNSPPADELRSAGGHGAGTGGAGDHSMSSPWAPPQPADAVSEPRTVPGDTSRVGVESRR